MKIKVLGSGCPKCMKLEMNVKEALQLSGKEATVEKVTEMSEIMSYNIMSTPALVIDEQVVSTGKLLSPKAILKYIQ